MDYPDQARALAGLWERAPSRSSLCRNHLRRFAGDALGMITNIKTDDLWDRLEWIYKRKHQLVDVRHVRQSWFRGNSGGVWRITPPPAALIPGGEVFDFDPVSVFNHFAGGGSWEKWLRDGTIILPGIFDHLRKVQAQIHEEFDMYAFHLGEQPGLPSMGWLRNMYHSGPQQLMYQDPVLWALTAAALSDRNWRLIAYPYNTKNAAAGQKTGFLHLDLDLARWRSEGLGKNVVQSSVSLTDENEKGCTLVVPGFHRHFPEWLETKKDLIDSRAASAARSTTDMKGMYTQEDRAKYGHPTPVPCPAFAARLSKSCIVHGSTSSGTEIRRVMFPWFTAINEDLVSLENPDCMGLKELSSCHMDLAGPSKESLGDTPRRGVAGVRFPGATSVKSPHALPQALVGLRKWTDPDVVFERNVLLGREDGPAVELAASMRDSLVGIYQRLYPRIELLERSAFGKRSFFAAKEAQDDMDGPENQDLDVDMEWLDGSRY